MVDAAPFCTGPWVVETAGLRVLGNQVSPTPHGEAAPCDGIRSAEVDAILEQLAGDASGSWEVLSSRDGVTVSKAKGEKTANVTLRVEASLPGVPAELAADQLSNFQNRCQWDSYCLDVELRDLSAGPGIVPGQLMHFALAASPLPPRDFVTHVVTMTAESGEAYLTYMRSVEHDAYPAGEGGRVRAELGSCLSAVRRNLADPENSSQLLLVTRQDMKLPFVPPRLVNFFAPLSLTDFVQKARAACRAKQASGEPPEVALFWRRGAAPAWRPAGGGPPGWVLSAGSKSPRSEDSTYDGCLSEVCYTASEAASSLEDAPWPRLDVQGAALAASEAAPVAGRAGRRSKLGSLLLPCGGCRPGSPAGSGGRPSSPVVRARPAALPRGLVSL